MLLVRSSLYGESEGAQELMTSYNQFLDSQAANSKTHYPKTPSQLQLTKAAEDFLRDHPSAFKTVEAKVKEQRRLAGASKRRKLRQTRDYRRIQN